MRPSYTGYHASSLPRTFLLLLWETMCDHQGLDIPSKCRVLMSAIQVSASVSPVSLYKVLAGASSLLKANDNYLCLGARAPWDSTPLALRQVYLSANEQSKQRRSMKDGVSVPELSRMLTVHMGSRVIIRALRGQWLGLINRTHDDMGGKLAL